MGSVSSAADGVGPHVILNTSYVHKTMIVETAWSVGLGV